MISPADIARVAELNSANFGPRDRYSSAGYLQGLVDCGMHILASRDGRRLVGYMLLWPHGNGYLEGLRSAIDDEYTGQGRGLRMYRRAIKLAAELDLIYWTYTSYDNLPSINAHVRAGMRVSGIRNGWVFFSARKD